jgi:hypothetical protein
MVYNKHRKRRSNDIHNKTKNMTHKNKINQ